MKSKRRIRSPHSGVRLKSRRLPSGRRVWFARYRDPDTGKERDITLTLGSHEARVAWAVQKSRALQSRRMELASGAPVRTETPIAAAVERFFEQNRARFKAGTVTRYRKATSQLIAWADCAGLCHVEGLSATRLADLATHLANRPAQVSAREQERGRRAASTRRRSPSSVNSDLAAIKAVLNDWRRHGLVPRLSRDAISDGLRPLKVPRNPPPFLTASQCSALLRAAIRHDAVTFTATRAEHAGAGMPGTTARYDAIAPFVAFVLLTGCRVGEARALRWADVDFDACDHSGAEVGEIRLRAEATKTGHARTITLGVSPGLLAILAQLKLRGASRQGYVFGGEQPMSADLLKSSHRRLKAAFGAPEFTWQTLRSTCATFLTNAPGVFGAASAFLSSKQLGHSVHVAERHYAGLLHGISRDARTLDDAMGVSALLSSIRKTLTRREPLRAVG